MANNVSLKQKKKLTWVQIWFGVVGADWWKVRIVETEFSKPFRRLFWWHEVRHPENKYLCSFVQFWQLQLSQPRRALLIATQKFIVVKYDQQCDDK